MNRRGFIAGILGSLVAPKVETKWIDITGDYGHRNPYRSMNDVMKPRGDRVDAILWEVPRSDISYGLKYWIVQNSSQGA